MLSFISQGLAIKKATHLKMLICTIRAILKKLKGTASVTNLPGRGPILIFTPHTARRVIREAQNSQRIIVGELQRKVASCGHQVSKGHGNC